MTEPVLGVWYRTPLSAKSHLFSPVEEPLSTGGSRAVPADFALCGKLISIDPIWWQESGWEEALGTDAFLVEETRKSGKCGPCGTRWKTVGPALDRAHPQPFDKSLRKRAEAARADATKTQRAMKDWFEHLWGEKVELIYE